MALQHLPIIGLCGGGGGKLSPERAKLVHDLGLAIGGLGAHLMVSASFAVANGAAESFMSLKPRRGIVLGNIARDGAGAFDRACCADDGTPYSSRCVEMAMFTTVENLESPRTQARSRVNVLTCDAVIVLPGFAGTRIEAEMATAGRADGRPLPLILLTGPAEEFPQELRALFVHVSDAAAARAHLCRELSRLGFTLIERKPASEAAHAQ